jgi:two-component system, NarL family, response regulator LiaR
MSETIRVMIVDDHAIVRSGLASLLQAFTDLEYVGDVSGGQEALQQIDTFKPDVVLMDLKMPGMNGIEATRRLLSKQPGLRVVILTSFDDGQEINEALKAGAISYLLKNAEVQEVVQAIREAHAGRPTLSPEITRALIQANRNPTPDYDLSERESDVLRLMARGMRNPQIAQELALSLSTVKFHVSAILRKLAVENRTEAVMLALQYNLVDQSGS